MTKEIITQNMQDILIHQLRLEKLTEEINL